MLQLIALAGAFHLHLAADYRAKLPDDQARGVDSFLASVEQVIPKDMKSVLARDFEVSFADLGSLSDIEKLTCPATAPKPASSSIVDNEDAVFVQVQDGKIVLNSEFVSEILKGESAAKTYSCGHQNFYRLAEAKLVHELAHFYDESAKVPGYSKIEWRNRTSQELCERQGNGYPLAVDEKSAAQCTELPARGGSYSGQYAFLNVAGFGSGLSEVQPRSPDIGEFAGPRESFATNFEYFLFDPSYACRRPTMAAALAAQFAMSVPSCAVNPVVGVARETEGKVTLESLDPSRIYEIQYVLAAPGSDAASRFGHSMLKIVRCAPERASVGPDCLQDVSSHLVVSFRANVHGFTVNNFSGLVGSYPAELFVSSLLDVLAEYNQGEMRDLVTLPLKLTDTQKSLLALRVVEEYWSYNDRYYFLSNNCAEGVLDLLRAVLPDESFSEKSNGVVSPNGLYDTLVQAGLLDPSMEKSADANGRYVFPALDSAVAQSFQGLLKLGAIPAGSELKTYVQSSTPATRKADYLAFKTKDPTDALPKNISEVALDFYAIEMVAQKSAEGKMKGDFTNWLAKEDSKSPEAQEIVKLNAAMVPWNFAHGGYGIPLASETPSTDGLSASLLQEANLMLDLEKSAPGSIAADRTELDAIAANLHFFIVETTQGR